MTFGAQPRALRAAASCLALLLCLSLSACGDGGRPPADVYVIAPAQTERSDPAPAEPPAVTPPERALPAASAPQAEEAPLRELPAVERTYVLNQNTGKFHLPSCASVREIKETNRLDHTGTRESVLAMGYEPCGRCHP